MTIGKIDLSKYSAERKKVICFAKNGNDVVQPYKTLYSVQEITGKEEHKNLWLECNVDKYGNKDFLLYEDLKACIYAIGRILPGVTITLFNSMVSGYPYAGKSGFLKRLEAMESKGMYINNLEVRMCELLGEFDLVKHYTEYRSYYLQKREEAANKARMEREKAEAEAEEARKKAIEKAIDDAEEKIFKQVDFYNNKVEEKSVINLLMQRYGIKVPLRTQGWINEKLAKIVFDGSRITYKFYGKSQRDNSKVFIDYLEELEAKINEKLQIPNF